MYRIPQSIASDRDQKFAARLWRSLQEHLGMELLFSTAAHPQTDGQSERVIRTREDMLRACVLNFPGNWHRHLPLVEFAYNNSYQASIQMAPYEALYDRKYRSPLHWDIDEVKSTSNIERDALRPEMIQEAIDKVQIIKKNMKTAQDRQKSYADKRRKDLKFSMGDQVFLKIAPQREIRRMGNAEKLSPRFIDPFEIVK